MQNLFINKGAILPSLRMELINDGRYDFMKSQLFYNAIQNADVTFSMWDEHNVLKISKAPCSIILVDEGGCDERYIIEYRWKERDTRKGGHYKGKINITFYSDLYQSGVTYDGGLLIMPIQEELDIYIRD